MMDSQNPFASAFAAVSRRSSAHLFPTTLSLSSPSPSPTTAIPITACASSSTYTPAPPNCKRLSFGGSSICQRSDPSRPPAPRRPSLSPSCLSIHHCGTSSSSSSSSSTSFFDSRTSLELKNLLSCVSRHSTHADCYRNRLIAWVAVKRNECDSISESEKLNCPLLRCGKNFDSHEALLKHVSICDELSSGEYYCPEHQCPERFDDGRDKVCGHPKKRRVLSMAKTFFSNLGHKSKNKKDLSSLGEDQVLDPTFDIFAQRKQLSASNNEIYELPASAPSDPFQLPTFDLPELSSLDTTTDPVASFLLSPPTDDQFPPALPHSPQTQRPSLQLDTLVSNQRPVRAPQSSRSNNLSHSSSVKSTASTNTVASTLSSGAFSTTSIGSQGFVSPNTPISTWSESSDPFLQMAGPNHTPWHDRPDVMEALRASAVAKEGEAAGDDLMTNEFIDLSNGIPELSGEPMESMDPMLGFSPAIPRTVTMDMSGSTSEYLDETILLGHSAPSSGDMVVDSTHKNGQNTSLGPIVPEDRIQLFSSAKPKNMVKAAWETLQELIAQTVSKLGCVDNKLAISIKYLSARNLAETGLVALEKELGGEKPDNPLEALCLVHLMYAFSVPTYEDHAPNKYQKMFSKALSMTEDFALEDQGDYTEIVIALWKPSSVAGEAPFGKQGQGQPFTASSVLLRTDAQVGQIRKCFGVVAQDFLDGLESSIVSTPAKSLPGDVDKAATKLRGDHVQDQAQTIQYGLMIASSINDLVVKCKTRFQTNRLHTQLDHVLNKVQRGDLCSARKAELQVLQAGKYCLDPLAFFDFFAPWVRHAFDSIYETFNFCSIPRLGFLVDDIAFIRSLISGPDSSSSSGAAFSVHDNTTMNEYIMEPEASGLTPPTINTTNPASIPHTSSASPFTLQSPLRDVVSPVCESNMVSATSVSPISTMHSSFPPMTGHGLGQPMGPSHVPFMSTGISPSVTQLHQVQARGQPHIHVPPRPQPHHQPMSVDQLPQPHPQVMAEFSSSSPVASSSSPIATPTSSKAGSHEACDICGYRPKGNPQWFQGSMSKHKKTKHSMGPDKMFRCPFPGCTSAYKNREDNLKQHMKEKNHFPPEGEDGGSEGEPGRKPSKRKRV